MPLQFFSNDFGIRGGGGEVGEDEDASQGQADRGRAQIGFGGQSGRSRNTGRGQLEVGRRRPVQHRSHGQRRFPVRPSADYDDALENDTPEVPRHNPDHIAAITGSTPLPFVSFSTTRPPRSAPDSFNGGLLSGRNLNIGLSSTTPPPAAAQAPQTQQLQPFVRFGSDGRKPRVKSNVRAKLANSGNGGTRKKFFRNDQREVSQRVDTFP